MRWGLITCALLLAACASQPPAHTPETAPDAGVKQDFAPGKPSVRAETKAAPVGDILHGNYETWWPNGKRAAVGHYLEGRRDGQWCQWYENGNPECEACFKDDLLIGKWRTWYANGRLQEQGDYVNGCRSGSWDLYAESGELVSRIRYAGGYPLGTEYGPAVVSRQFPDIDGYSLVRMSIRHSSDGVMIRDGDYRAWHANGAVAAEGQYRADHKFGLWRLWHDNGKKSQVAFYDDQAALHGSWSAWHTSGMLKEEGEYEHGQREGRWFSRTEQGVQILSYYKAGRLHGPYLERGPDDDVLVVGRYDEGTPVGDWMQASERGMIVIRHGNSIVDERYESGRVKARGTRHENLRTGQWTFFHENGQLALEATFDKDKLNGPARSFRADGSRWREATYAMGERSGIATEWDEEGLSYLQGSWDFNKTEGVWELFDWMGNRLKRYKRAGGKWQGEEAAPGPILERVTRYEGGAIETRWQGFELQGERFMHGEFKRYYPDGKLKVWGQFTNNVATGEWMYYYPNEKPMLRGDYKLGERAGIWCFYHDNGELSRRGRYGQDWEKPLELQPSQRGIYSREVWELELDWRGFEASFPERRESWIYYSRTGEVADRKYFTPRRK